MTLNSVTNLASVACPLRPRCHGTGCQELGGQGYGLPSASSILTVFCTSCHLWREISCQNHSKIISVNHYFNFIGETLTSVYCGMPVQGQKAVLFSHSWTRRNTFHHPWKKGTSITVVSGVWLHDKGAEWMCLSWCQRWENTHVSRSRQQHPSRPRFHARSSPGHLGVLYQAPQKFFQPLPSVWFPNNCHGF